MAGEDSETFSSDISGTEIDEDSHIGRRIRFRKEVEYIPPTPTKSSFLSIFERKDKKDNTHRGRRGTLHPSDFSNEENKSSSCCVRKH